MTALKLTAIGTSTGMVIPNEMLDRLKVGKGDALYAIETAEGYLLTPNDPAIAEEMKLGDGS
ncbi:MAG: AbrB/MazE/SpoVT family DNA-binding domain-containing protein [Methylocella sp.]